MSNFTVWIYLVDGLWFQRIIARFSCGYCHANGPIYICDLHSKSGYGTFCKYLFLAIIYPWALAFGEYEKFKYVVYFLFAACWQEKQLFETVDKAYDEAWELIHNEEGWKEEKKSDKTGDVVFSRKNKKGRFYQYYIYNHLVYISIGSKTVLSIIIKGAIPC